MEQSLAEKISANPDYQRLKNTRSRFGWTLTIAMLVVYYGYILLIAFDKEWLGTKLGTDMTTSIGIPLGVGVIVVTIILTNIYVRRANTKFDDMNAQIIKEASKK